MPVYFEAAAVIIVLVLIGQVLELRARAKVNLQLEHVLHMAMTSRYVLRNGVTLRPTGAAQGRSRDAQFALSAGGIG